MYDFITLLSYSNIFYATILEIVCGNVVCDAPGETCVGESCSCGSSDSCVGNPAGEYCDAINSICKCTLDIDACPQGQTCTNGACGRPNLINEKFVSL